jgi:hypothetical protein
MYYWYYATLAMKERGGDDWNFWNSHLRDMLIEKQVRRGSGVDLRDAAYHFLAAP